MKKIIPPVFYGTAWKADKTADLVSLALKKGFRGIDTACQPKHYNEFGVGEGISRSGIAREQLFIQTKYTPFDGQDPNKIPYNPKDDLPTQVRTSLEVSLKNLKTQYLDSLVLHSPLSSLSKTLEVWRTFEEFVKQGKVHHLGISNCYDPQFFQKLYAEAQVKPSFIQNRFYKNSNYDGKIRAFCDKNKIIYQSFWTLTANPQILKHQLIISLSKKYKKTPQQIFYRGLTQLSILPLIGTTSEKHMQQDLQIFTFELDKEEVSFLQQFFI